MNEQNLFIQEDWIDKKRGCGLGSSEIYETSYSKSGELYSFLRREYGRCVSSIYIDFPGKKKSKKIGWVFQKKEKYVDTHEDYIKETWVTVHKSPPKVTTEYNYLYL